jgi:1-deoxy-D-xylulose-5-phosphate reductoisomerase
MVSDLQPDLVLNAAVGFAGLAVSVAALESGADLALANKESLVAGGELVTALAEANGVSIIPVDSEHASLAQLIGDIPAESVESVSLTASGGPFRGRSAADLERVTVEEALAHPTWSMGGKITIDSATMMNKGLEVIEARHLFRIGYDRIRVVVHPQSIVHALASLVDGMVLAHLGHPDMRAPIAWALAHPERPRLDTERLDLASVGRLEFESPDEIAFPGCSEFPATLKRCTPSK